MSKFRAYTIAGLAFCIGVVAGAYDTHRVHTFAEWHISATGASVAANLQVATLRSIRAGDTNKAVDRLEEQLDREVLSLADICRECQRPDVDRFPFEALGRARDYRVQFPRATTSPVIDGAVARALTLADKNQRP